MKSSNQEPKGFFDGFRIIDFVIIYCVADVLATGIISMLTAGTGIWLVVVACCGWWLFIHDIQNDIKNGKR